MLLQVLLLLLLTLLSFPLDVAVGVAAFASVSQLLLMSMPAVSLHDSHSLKHNLVFKIT
jgi:hypothetical protein